MLRAMPIFLTFLLMGIADAMGPLSSAVRDNPFMAALMPFFVFIAFAIFSVPGGVLAARYGKKNILMLGLALSTIAVGVPAFFHPPFVVLLMVIFLLGIGTTFLQVSGNPIMKDVSAQGSYSKNLALAQGIKGLGSTTSAFGVTAIGSIALFSGMGWRGAFPIFFVLMGIALVSVSTLKIEETKAEVPPSVMHSLALLKEPVFALSVLGIFLYVGAEVCMATYLKPVFVTYGFDDKQAALFGPSLFFGSLTLGRLVAGAIKISPLFFFRLSSAMGLVGLLFLIAGQRSLLIPAVGLAGLGFANIWPMLFSITVLKKPALASELSGLMCMAISGGAVIPLVMGRLGGGGSTLPFIVPATCFLYLVILSVRTRAVGSKNQ